MRTSLAPFVLVAGLWAVPAAAVEPANPATNAQARAVLDYLARLPQRQDQRVLSGQFTSYGSGASARMVEEAHHKTGHWPAMIGLDYADFGSGGLHTATVNRVAMEYARQGGLVTISAHLYNPVRAKGGGLRDKGVDLNQLLTPGNEVHTRWLREMDLLAEGLQELQANGVVVLWRPFHEMNGGWFWWGGQDPQVFQRLWRQMFDYFTQTKKLNNLLWVYGPNHGQKTAAYYAGDRYVDVVGLDAYTDYVDREHIKGYEEIVALGKPLGIHRVWAARGLESSGRLRLSPLDRRDHEGLSPGNLLPLVARQVGIGEQPAHQGTARTPLDRQSRETSEGAGRRGRGEEGLSRSQS